MCQRLQHRSFNGDGRHPTRYYPSVPTAGYSSRCDTKGYSSRCCAIRRVQVTEEATACGRTNHSPQSKEITAFDEWNCRADVACVGADLRVRPPNRLRSGEDGRTHRSAPTEIGVTAFDEWNCRADVACVGADLRVRPQNRLRSGEDRRTHRSAPTVGSPTPLSGSPEEKSTELPKREKTSLFTCI